MDVIDSSSILFVFDCLVCIEEFENRQILLHHMLAKHTQCRKVDLSRRESPPKVEESLDEPPPKKLKSTTKRRVQIVAAFPVERSELMYVDRTIRNHRLFTCHLCNARINDLDECRTHTAEHIEDEQCLVCSRRLKIIRKLQNHVLQHMKVSEYMCLICDKDFASDYQLRKHAWKVHSDENTCCVCDTEVASQESLRQHFDKHHRWAPLVTDSISDADVSICNQEQNLGGNDVNIPSLLGVSTNGENQVFISRVEPDYQTDTDIDSDSTTAQTSIDDHEDDDSLTAQLIDACRSDSVQKKARNGEKRPHGQDEKPFVCGECGARFGSQRGMSIHYKRIHATYHYICECGLRFTTVSTLDEHRDSSGHKNYIDTEDNVLLALWEEWVLSMGPLNTVEDDQINAKMETQNDEENGKNRKKNGRKKGIIVYACKCGTKHTTKGCLRRHIEDIHLEIKNYRCECGNGFYSKPQLDIHRKFKKHENLSVSGLKDDRSEETSPLSLVGDSSSKRTTKDSGTPDVMCHQCGEVLPSLKHLSRHEQLHKNIVYQCPHCQLSFEFPNKLKRHMKTHVDNELVNCDKCRQVFSNFEELRQHNRSVHFDIGKSELTCEVCCRQFECTSNLETHRMKHDRSKNYVCICGKAFYLRSHLNSHYNDVHSVDKPFTCPVCKRDFSRKYGLIQHMSRHTTERPFSCSMCDSAFKLKDHLNCHIKRVHYVFRPKTNIAKSNTSSGMSSNENAPASDGVVSSHSPPRSASDTNQGQQRKVKLNVVTEYINGVNGSGLDADDSVSVTEVTGNATLDEETSLEIDGVFEMGQNSNSSVALDIVDGELDRQTIFKCSDCEEYFLDFTSLAHHCLQEHDIDVQIAS